MARNEYILWPDPTLAPSPTLRVGWGETANGANVVHSPSGHEWTKVPEGDQSADLIRLRDAITSAAKIDLSQLSTTNEDGTTDLVASRIWSSVIRSKAAEIEKITASMIDVGTLRVGNANITSLDAGKITSGVIDAQRIAAGSITAAQLATGTITANSGVIGSLDADKITTGTLKAAQIDVESLRGKELRGGVVTSGKDEQNEIRLGDGTLQAKSNGSITGRLTQQNGLEVVNPRTKTLQSLNPLVFGGLAHVRDVNQRVVVLRPSAGQSYGGEVQVSAGVTIAASDRFVVLVEGYTNQGRDQYLRADVIASVTVIDQTTKKPVWSRGIGTLSSRQTTLMALPTGLVPGEMYDFRVFYQTLGQKNLVYQADTAVEEVNIAVIPM